MGHRSHDAARKDAQIKLKKEEYASIMGQSTNVAARKDAQIELSMEESASRMGQKSHAKYAAVKDAQT